VVKTNDLIEGWIQIPLTLQRHLKMLQADKPPAGTVSSSGAAKSTIARVKTCVEESNSMLKEHASGRAGVAFR
jgi:uncharacterized protein YerC